MNRVLVSVLIVVLLLTGCTAPAEGIEVHEAWARPTAAGENGAVYFILHSSEPEELVGASSDVAEVVELHESRMSGDVMQMRQIQSIPFGAGEEVVFEPGGLHIMLVNLKQDLKAGDEIRVTLHFKNYEDVLLLVPVQDTPSAEHQH